METRCLLYNSTQRAKLHSLSCFFQQCLWANIPIKRNPSTRVLPQSCLESSKAGNTGEIAVTMSATCGGSRLVPPRYLSGTLHPSRQRSVGLGFPTTSLSETVSTPSSVQVQNLQVVIGSSFNLISTASGTTPYGLPGWEGSCGC